ncbi:endonuclease domain-containing protein [Asticcacaulis sp. SL142]|uniref:endonuclease domain-containing protein n=1 Tax=Asticcacaulis sp. SL142 TaxID=2995155 RepID=UPI00226C6657|nr:endonuclease domain-containing protein [Asticcacaulis sp. SL142]WAC49271.1 endonuclease domain-containing protein [Asticcacaulis sp. SL142]
MNPPKPRLKYELARQFRKDLTPPEVRLWARIKGKPDGIHFRKQHPIGPYIADFYCAAARLVVEVDGQVHNLSDVAERDEGRLAWLGAQGLEVMRINAADIMRDADEAALGVLMRARAVALSVSEMTEGA